jgi:hypothetical protein
MNERPEDAAAPDPAQPAEPAAATGGPFPVLAGTAELPTELGDYPVQLGITRQDEYSRWLPLVKWLLAIPHYVVLVILGIGALFALIGAFFAVLFTGNYPRGIFDFMLGVQRWALRVSAYVLLMADPYPPFSLDDDPSYPVRLDIAYPEGGVDNWRPLVHWLLIIPYLFVAAILVWVAGILEIITFFAILFTRQFPEGLFVFTEVALRWQARANAYYYFMTTRYPPFAWG